MKEKFICNFPIERITPLDGHYFFGYYDKCPWTINEDRVLVNKVSFVDRMPTVDDYLEVGYINRNRQFVVIDNVNTWSWQEGCRLQWYCDGKNNEVIYNCSVGGEVKSKIKNLTTGEEQILPLPIYTVNKSGDFALTVNFSRLYSARKSYGYNISINKNKIDSRSDDDGVFVINIATKEVKLLISLSDLYKYKYIESMDGGIHWVQHIELNDEGRKFTFLHRWITKAGGTYTRLFVSDLSGNIECLLDSGMFSHSGWQNNNTVVGWGRKGNSLSKIRKKTQLFKILLPIYHKIVKNNKLRSKIASDSYLEFKIETGEASKLGDNWFDQDGHCSWDKSGRFMITDTYADSSGNRHLYLYDKDKDKKINIGSFYSIPFEVDEVKDDWNSSGMRCDLHPRFNVFGDKVCIDSVHEGIRQMYVIDISDVINS